MGGSISLEKKDASTTSEDVEWNAKDLVASDWELIGTKLKTKRDECASVVVDHCIFTIGGIHGNNWLSSVERFDTLSNEQTNIPPMNIRRSGFAAVAIEKKIYVIGGHDGNQSLDSVEVFDLKKENNSGWVILQYPMKKRRYGCVAVAFNDCIYVVGGGDESVEMYNTATSEWKEVTPMSTSRNFPSAVVVAGCIYVMGGQNRYGIVSSMESYIIKEKKWNLSLPPMITSRVGGFSVSISNDSFIVMGGKSPWTSSSDSIAKVEAYHTQHKKWVSLPELTIERGYGSGVNVDGVIYAVGGRDGHWNELDSIEKMQLECLMDVPPPPPLPHPPIEFHSRKRIQALEGYVSELMNLNEEYLDEYNRKKDQCHGIVQNKIEHFQSMIQKEIDHHKNMIFQLEQKWNKNEKLKVQKWNDVEDKFEKVFSSWIDEFTAKLEEAKSQVDLLKSGADRKGSDVPNHLLCPITLEIMTDPVIASDGFTYEREAIERVLYSSAEPRSPNTNEAFANHSLIQNNAIRSLCRDYLSKD